MKSVQNGLGERGARSPATGRPACGEQTLEESELEKRRVDFGAQIHEHPLVDGYYADRTPDFARIAVPLLSSGN